VGPQKESRKKGKRPEKSSKKRGTLRLIVYPFWPVVKGKGNFFEREGRRASPGGGVVSVFPTRKEKKSCEPERMGGKGGRKETWGKRPSLFSKQTSNCVGEKEKKEGDQKGI